MNDSLRIPRSVLLHPELADAIDTIKAREKQTFPEYLATDARVVSHFKSLGKPVPVTAKSGRPRKPTPPPAPHVEDGRKPLLNLVFGDENLDQS